VEDIYFAPSQNKYPPLLKVRNYKTIILDFIYVTIQLEFQDQ
jgi:hypothetical protein